MACFRLGGVSTESARVGTVSYRVRRKVERARASVRRLRWKLKWWIVDDVLGCWLGDCGEEEEVDDRSARRVLAYGSDTRFGPGPGGSCYGRRPHVLETRFGEYL